MSNSFIGTKPYQVPTNNDLGRLAFLDHVGLADVGNSIPTIASATAIAPLTQILYVSGTAEISTITVPPIIVNGGEITIIPTGAFTITTSGNVAVTISAEVNKPLRLTYEAVGNKWYPSYSNTVNRVTVTAPASSSTLTINDGKTLIVEKSIKLTSSGNVDNKILTVDENLTLAGNDGKVLTLNASVTLQTVSNNAITLNLGSRTIGTIGWSDVPQRVENGSYNNFTVDDVGKHFYHSNLTAGDIYIIPAGVFAIGATLMFVNRGANLTIRCDPAPTGSPAPAIESLLQAITGASGPRTLAGFGVATMLKITATEWIISGTGLS
jgi:hypothetical protein